ncbi:MAG: AlpA family phage regulatory protein [Defluviicoccus sp.]|nr:AlpA family phage regulatory protein [Defluviicoccus sp.]
MSTGLSRASTYRLIRADDLSVAIRLGSRAVAWGAQQIDEWIASRGRFREAVGGEERRRQSGCPDRVRA